MEAYWLHCPGLLTADIGDKRGLGELRTSIASVEPRGSEEDQSSCLKTLDKLFTRSFVIWPGAASSLSLGAMTVGLGKNALLLARDNLWWPSGGTLSLC